MMVFKKVKAHIFFVCVVLFCLYGVACFAGEPKPVWEDAQAPTSEPEQSTSVGINNEQIEILRAALQEASKMRLELNPEEEYYLGRAVTAQILTQYKPYDCPALNQYLNMVGQSLALFSSRPELYNGYRFLVLDSEEINAFASPGGHILVTRGLIKVTTNEDELAAVLAHEIAHVALKHGASSIEGLRLTDILSQAAISAGLASKGQVADFTAAFGDAIAALAKQIIVSGYSQAYEFQADKEACNILSKAHYDPQALARLISRLPEPGAGNSGYIKTHPERESRLAMLSKIQVPDRRIAKKPRANLADDEPGVKQFEAPTALGISQEENWAPLTVIRDERYRVVRKYF